MKKLWQSLQLDCSVQFSDSKTSCILLTCNDFSFDALSTALLQYFILTFWSSCFHYHILWHKKNALKHFNAYRHNGTERMRTGNKDSSSDESIETETKRKKKRLKWRITIIHKSNLMQTCMEKIMFCLLFHYVVFIHHHIGIWCEKKTAFVFLVSNDYGISSILWWKKRTTQNKTKQNKKQAKTRKYNMISTDETTHISKH